MPNTKVGSTEVQFEQVSLHLKKYGNLYFVKKNLTYSQTCFSDV